MSSQPSIKIQFEISRISKSYKDSMIEKNKELSLTLMDISNHN